MSWVSKWWRSIVRKTVLNQLLIDKLLEIAREKLEPYTNAQLEDFVTGMSNHETHPMVFDVQWRGRNYQAIGFLVPKSAGALDGQVRDFAAWMAKNVEHVATHSGPLRDSTERSDV